MPGTSSHNMAGVAAHQVAMFKPVSPVTNAPAAAGLKICRPRQASAYLEAEASTHARATPAMSRGREGRPEQEVEEQASDEEDSECGRTWNRAARPRLET